MKFRQIWSAMDAEQRTSVFMGMGAVFFIGWIASASYFQVPMRWRHEQQLVHVETKVIPVLETRVKQLDCDKTKLSAVATQAIASNVAPVIPTPGFGDVRGCPKVSPVKPKVSTDAQSSR